MKKIMIYIVLFAISSLTSCNKQTGSIITKEEIKTLSKDEIKFIGMEHNKLCIQTFDKLRHGNIKLSGLIVGNNVQLSRNNTYTNDDLFNALNETLVANSYNMLSVEEFSYYQSKYSPEFIDETVASSINSISNTQQQIIIQDLIAAINSFPDYQILYQQLSLLKERAESELAGIDQTSTLISIEVAINSAYMWYPVDKGGLGYLDLPNTGLNTSSITSSGNTLLSSNSFGNSVGRVVIADAVGAFGGFCRAALPNFLSGGPVNPVSNGVLLGSALIGGATSSCATAFQIAAK